MTKQISYRIADTQITKRITLYLDKVRTISDLKNAIASDLKVNINNIDFKNPPTEKQIIDKNDYFILTVILKNFQRDIEFHLSKRTIITIKNANQMSFLQVIDEFEKNRIYFSDNCLKHYMCFYSNDQKLNLHDDYPFLFISTFVIVKIIDEKVIMKYDDYIFCFTEYEKIETAYDFINDIFYDSTDVIILNSQKKKISDLNEYLFADEKYYIKLEYTVYFSSMNDPQYSERLRFNCIPTVSDAKEYIAILKSSENYQINQDNVFIFDKHKKLIHDINKRLSSIQKLEKNFYYSIDLNYSQQVYEEERKIKKKQKRKNKNKKNKKVQNSDQKSDNAKNGFNSPEKVNNLNNQQNQNNGFDEHESEGDLSLPVFFTFEEPNDKKYTEFVNIFPIKTTADQIKQSICKKHSIENSINIEYKSNNTKNVILPHQTLEEIKDKIKEIAQNGESKCHIYIEIIDKPSNKSSKNKYDEYDDDEEDDNDKAKKPSIKQIDVRDVVVPESSEKVKIQKNKIVKKPKPTIQTDPQSSDDEKTQKKTVKKPKPLIKPVEEEGEKDDKEPPKENERKRINKKIFKPSTKPANNDDEDEDDYDIEKSRSKKIHDDESENSHKKNSKPVRKKSTKKTVNFDDSDNTELPSESDDKTSKSEKEPDENENENKKSKTKKKSTKSFKPKINQIQKEKSQQSSSTSQDTSEESELRKFQFKCNEKIQKISLDINTNLKENEQFIKQKMKINQNNEIEFILVKEILEEEDNDDDDENDDEENFLNKKRKLKNFKNLSLFRIFIKSKPKSTPNQPKKKKQNEEEEEENEDDEMLTYHYQTNRDEKVEKVKLNGKATVKTLKEFIANKKGVGSASNVKIIFAGKELLNNIVLKSLEVSDTTLFVYLRTEKEVFLMTAKALQHVYESSSNEEESEYE